MSYAVTLTLEAKNDLREIYRYLALALQSEQNANGQLDRLEENILKLDEMPERFRLYDPRTMAQPEPAGHAGGQLLGILYPGQREKNRHGAPCDVRQTGY